MALTEIGVITRPQGLKGHFRVRAYSNFSFDIKFVIIKNKEYTVDKITDRKTFLIFKLSELNFIDDIEGLRNEVIYANIEKKPLEKGEYYIDDLIGAKVIADNKDLGVVKNVYQWGAADVFEIEDAKTNKSFMFPFARDVLLSFDKENKVLTLDNNILQEIKIDS